MSTAIKRSEVVLSRGDDGRVPFYRHDGKACQWNALLLALGAEPLTPNCLFAVRGDLYADAEVVIDGEKKRFMLCPGHANADLHEALNEILGLEPDGRADENELMSIAQDN